MQQQQADTSLDDDNEVQILDGLDVLRQTVAFKDAFIIFKGRAFGAPVVAVLQEYLELFKDEYGDLAFINPETLSDFKKIQSDIVETYGASKSARSRVWKKGFAC